MTDEVLALRYAPILHMDEAETIPLQFIGYTVFHETSPSPSFRRMVTLPEDALCVLEYAYYWDYDIQHMYDLEHIWVTVGPSGAVLSAQGSFHGKYLNLLVPELPGGLPPSSGHIHAYCQPGKHAFAVDGQLFRLVPGWQGSCNSDCGGEVLVGGPFGGVYGKTAADDARCARYIREHLAFTPTLRFRAQTPDASLYLPWPALRDLIPRRIQDECARLRMLYGGET